MLDGHRSSGFQTAIRANDLAVGILDADIADHLSVDISFYPPAQCTYHHRCRCTYLQRQICCLRWPSFLGSTSNGTALAEGFNYLVPGAQATVNGVIDHNSIRLEVCSIWHRRSVDSYDRKRRTNARSLHRFPRIRLSLSSM